VLAVARKTATKIDDYAISIVKGPLFVFIVLLGLITALRYWDSKIPGTLPSWISLNIDNLTSIMIVLVAASTVSLIVENFFSSHIKRIIKESPDKETAFRLLQRVIIYLIYLIAAIVVISLLFPGAETALYGVIVGAGFTAIVIGLAAQKVLGNIFSGIFIHAARPYRIGDAVMFRDQYGNIEDITFRHTIIRTWDNKRLIVPNSKIDEEVIINYTIKDMRMLGKVNVGISYDSDLEKAKKIMIEIAKSHPNCLPDMEPRVQLLDFGDSAIQLRLLFMAKDQPTAFGTECEIREQIKKRFDEEGIEIPFPRRYIILGEDKTGLTEALKHLLESKESK
jgi:small-conductance mechanosensitive channel